MQIHDAAILFKVHIITADAYTVGMLNLVKRETHSKSGHPRLLDVLNNPTVYVKTSSGQASSVAVTITQGIRYSFHGLPPKPFEVGMLRLDSVLFGSDEIPPELAGTVQQQASAPERPEAIELWLRGGIRVTGIVRGGSKAVLYPRADQQFFAATRVAYAIPREPDNLRDLAFAAVNTRFIEAAFNS